MTFSRRRFLKTSTIVALSAGIPTKLAQVASAQRPETIPGRFPIPIDVQGDPLSYLTLASFLPYVNSDFAISATRVSNAERITLVSVTDTSNGLKPAKTSRRKLVPDVVWKECFSLVFRGSPESQLRQDVYELQHLALGNFRLLLVPVGSVDKNFRYYEAVINRSQP